METLTLFMPSVPWSLKCFWKYAIVCITFLFNSQKRNFSSGLSSAINCLFVVNSVLYPETLVKNLGTFVLWKMNFVFLVDGIPKYYISAFDQNHARPTQYFIAVVNCDSGERCDLWASFYQFRQHITWQWWIHNIQYYRTNHWLVIVICRLHSNGLPNLQVFIFTFYFYLNHWTFLLSLFYR